MSFIFLHHHCHINRKVGRDSDLVLHLIFHPPIGHRSQLPQVGSHRFAAKDYLLLRFGPTDLVLLLIFDPPICPQSLIPRIGPTDLCAHICYRRFTHHIRSCDLLLRFGPRCHKFLPIICSSDLLLRCVYMYIYIYICKYIL